MERLRSVREDVRIDGRDLPLVDKRLELSDLGETEAALAVDGEVRAICLRVRIGRRALALRGRVALPDEPGEAIAGELFAQNFEAILGEAGRIRHAPIGKLTAAGEALFGEERHARIFVDDLAVLPGAHRHVFAGIGDAIDPVADHPLRAWGAGKASGSVHAAAFNEAGIALGAFIDVFTAGISVACIAVWASTADHLFAAHRTCREGIAASIIHLAEIFFFGIRRDRPIRLRDDPRVLFDVNRRALATTNNDEPRK